MPQVVARSTQRWAQALNARAARALDVELRRIHRAHPSSIRGAARRMIELTLGGALALLLVCFIACGMRNTQRMTSALELMEADYQVTLDRVREAEARDGLLRP